MTTETRGTVVRVAGPVVAASGLRGARLYDVVHVGRLRLIGEIIRLEGDLTTVQVYEDTAGLQVGEPVFTTGGPLVVDLGPGLIGQVYDGLQRPLESLAEVSGAFLERGLIAPALAKARRWAFQPLARVGQEVEGGDILGTIPESAVVEHRVMVPPGLRGQVESIYKGHFTLDDPVAIIREAHTGQRTRLTLHQQWPVRQPRPIRSKLDPDEPLITGQRITDTFFPVAKGGTAIIPGGFGTGKTVFEHQLARWAGADVVVYVGCGERGNEMTEVLETFPELEDPRHGTPLMDRTILIANTSNMPVAAREASIYTGITMAEYYRDMGYDVVVLADSTSRWGEALREISGRLEEMPGEEGYPAYLVSRLAEFYERAGRVTCLSNDGRTGSVTIVGAVSPPGGDFSEPMTQHSLRVAGTFWGLDYDLSRRRHFPAINWTQSYTLYPLQGWFARNAGSDWNALVREAMALLQLEVELLEIVQLVGPDALAETERAVLAVARILREDYLQQSAYHEIDTYCPLEKSYWMLQVIMTFHHQAKRAVEAGVSLERIMRMPVVGDIARMKEWPVREAPERLQALMGQIEEQFAGL